MVEEPNNQMVAEPEGQPPTPDSGNTEPVAPPAAIDTNSVEFKAKQYDALLPEFTRRSQRLAILEGGLAEPKREAAPPPISQGQPEEDRIAKLKQRLREKYEDAEELEELADLAGEATCALKAMKDAENRRNSDDFFGYTGNLWTQTPQLADPVVDNKVRLILDDRFVLEGGTDSVLSKIRNGEYNAVQIAAIKREFATAFNSVKPAAPAKPAPAAAPSVKPVDLAAMADTIPPSAAPEVKPPKPQSPKTWDEAKKVPNPYLNTG
jgi:hypothetical protein